ncbi:MAG TPA: beta-N-acetylhexosaminidase [Tepidisphaeraceae bacterium]|jgi:hypothetical protein|nr:beta-N-acetylhexosaminidase [Tepidisphaeraceae bacterium]
MLNRFLAALTLLATSSGSAFASPLAEAGYAVLPMPQSVKLSGKSVRLTEDWKIAVDAGLKNDDVAVEALKDEFSARHHLQLTLEHAPAGAKFELTVAPGSVAIGAAQDRDRDALAAQAYRIDIGDKLVHITANAPAGLFYGVETLAQLAKDGDGVTVPAGEIVDWPDLQLRQIYWDDAHHLERPDALRHAIRQTAFFKINAFVIKLEGHFQYRSAPAIVEPYALSPAEFQELTDYAGHYHVQLVPYLDSPAHIAFILKHPEYSSIREFADSDYELSTVDPDSFKLMTGMFADLLDANKGVKYFYLSTDEPYYLGRSTEGKFPEAPRMKELGSPGKLLADFLGKTAGYLHEHGRTVIFWGEYPMKPADVATLPPYLINGETDNGDFDAACKSRGIRQSIYTSTEGEEKLFPDYVLAPPDRLLHKRDGGKPRVAEAIETIKAAGARKNADLMGMLVAGWGDMGLHPETFWLGYVSATAAGWNPATEPAQAAADFYRIFYGPSAVKMDRVYELMSTQAQYWADSWEGAPSTLRKGIWGNSNSIYNPRHPAHDQTIKLPPVPNAKDLSANGKWSVENTRLIDQATTENTELLDLLAQNLKQAEFNHYNLEVFQSIAKICSQNLQMFRQLAEMNSLLNLAAKQAADKKDADAVASLDSAIGVAEQIRRDRNEVLKDTTATWYKSWYPRVAEANGRTFLHELDDVKDHLPDRTVGMEYLVYRELNLPMDKWVEQVSAARNAFAAAHELPKKTVDFGWGKTE